MDGCDYHLAPTQNELSTNRLLSIFSAKSLQKPSQPSPLPFLSFGGGFLEMAARSLSSLLPSSKLFSASDGRRIVGRRPTSLSSLASSRRSGLSSSLLFGAPLLPSATQLPLNQRRGPSAMVAANSTPPTAEYDSAPTGETPKQSVSVPAEKKTPKMSARMIKSIALAEMEARKLRYPTRGTEALLMGILVEGTSVAANFLRAHRITLSKVREEIVNLLGKGDRTYISPVDIPLTGKAQRAIDLAIEEKMKSGEDGEVTAVHLLLGIWAQQDSAGHKVLATLGFDDQKAMELAKLANGGDAVRIFR